MERYKDLSGYSGVNAYEILEEGIVLQLANGSLYLYDHEMPGKKYVAAMKRLAKEGKGLTAYVTQKVRGNYKKIL